MTVTRDTMDREMQQFVDRLITVMCDTMDRETQQFGAHNNRHVRNYGP